jgi:RNA polymerase sigma factor (sigma-70 family)
VGDVASHGEGIGFGAVDELVLAVRPRGHVGTPEFRRRIPSPTNTHDTRKFAPARAPTCLNRAPEGSTLSAPMSAKLIPPADASPENRAFVADMRPALVQYFKRKTGSSVEAEDLAQDVLVRALTHAHWKSPGEARGYIFRTAVNRWRDRLRRKLTQGKTVSWDEAAGEAQGVENPPERVLMVREEFAQVLQLLDGMSERTQAILMLIKLEKMKAATVAEMLGISESAVNKHLAKGLARLAELRKGQEGT